MADEYTFASSLAPQGTEFEFDTRQFVYIPDQNNSSYPSGQITMDLAGLSNSGKFVDWKQSFLTIPLILNVNCNSGAFATANVENAFAASLKNSTLQLINSISVEITNNQVVNLTNFSNIHANYKLLNKISSEEISNLAPSILFGKDTAESITYTSAASAGGLGECNNVILESTFTPAGGWGAKYTQNKGRADRMKYTSFDPAATNAANFTNTTITNNTGKNYATYTTTNLTFYITATIPMRFIHDLFDKMPLVRGAYIRLLINTSTQCQVGMDLASTGTTYATTNYSVQSPTNQIPFMLSPLTTGSGFVAAGTSAKIIASLGIAKSVVPAGTFTHQMSQCRLYACCYTMSPSYEEKYLSILPTKTIKYNDILSFQQLNVAPGANVNWILTNGVSRARSVTIYPFISGTVNGSTSLSTYTAGVAVGSPLLSPFSSAPGTCAPYHRFTNFNILLSGSNVYQSNYQYTWETFLQENRPSLCLNGGLTLGMSSGCLGQSDFENAYGMAYVDLSRKISPASDDVSRSVQTIFTNSSLYTCDYYAIIEYEREITISTSTGSLVI